MSPATLAFACVRSPAFRPRSHARSRPRPAPVATIAVAAALAAMAAAGCDEDGQPAEPFGIKVATRNLYLGSEFDALLVPTTPAAIPAAAATIWGNVQNSRFPERAAVLAAQIAAEEPDVVALQEVSLYRTQTPSDWTSGAAPNADEVALDFLATLLGELEARGARYTVAAIGMNADAELPVAAPGGTEAAFDMRLTDRDVILVRDGVAAAAAGGGTYVHFLSFPIGGAGGTMLKFNRGYVMADVTVPGGRPVRIVDAHLEVGGPLLGTIQEQQARELAVALAPIGGPVILAGDFNSPASGTGTASYHLLTTTDGSSAPFGDAWNDAGVGDGFTCCVNIQNAGGVPSSRIDLVLHRGPVTATSAMVFGLAPPNPTPSGLWPSDHFGMSTRIEVR